MAKRRLIKMWTVEFVASTDYECDQCGTKINAATVYFRRVLATSTRLEVEREHAKPNCPDRYYE